MGRRGPKPGSLTGRPRVNGKFAPVVRPITSADVVITPVSVQSAAPIKPDAVTTPARPPDPKQPGSNAAYNTTVPIAAIIDALRASYGLKAIAGEKLGLDLDTMRYYENTYAEVKAECERQNERINDIAELGLIKRLLAGDIRAISFRLKTKAKDRGFIERVEWTGPNGDAISFTLNLGDKGGELGGLHEAPAPELGTGSNGDGRAS